MKPSPVRDKSFKFAVDAVKLCRSTRDPDIRPLIMQFMRAGTSIAANVEEAVAAQSRKDFLHKMSVASKEAREANYWLRLLLEAGVLSSPEVQTMLSSSSELIRMLSSIVRTTGDSMPSANRNSKLKTQNSKLSVARSTP